MFCEKNHVFVKEQCPAWGKTCMGCKGKNHFKGSRKCPMHKGKILYVDCDDNSDNSSTDTEELYCLEAVVNKCD